jgi:hypothetical protein
MKKLLLSFQTLFEILIENSKSKDFPYDPISFWQHFLNLYLGEYPQAYISFVYSTDDEDL